ncbi:hypothetical protein F4678DRAFT_422438 [Xylaria arbuscula]|nr:hypothetical protein F4678DRAFT_422438 [Xylaria arbuscula]
MIRAKECFGYWFLVLCTTTHNSPIIPPASLTVNTDGNVYLRASAFQVPPNRILQQNQLSRRLENSGLASWFVLQLHCQTTQNI